MSNKDQNSMQKMLPKKNKTLEINDIEVELTLKK